MSKPDASIPSLDRYDDHVKVSAEVAGDERKEIGVRSSDGESRTEAGGIPNALRGYQASSAMVPGLFGFDFLPATIRFRVAPFARAGANSNQTNLGRAALAARLLVVEFGLALGTDAGLAIEFQFRTWTSADHCGTPDGLPLDWQRSKTFKYGANKLSPTAWIIKAGARSEPT